MPGHDNMCESRAEVQGYGVARPMAGVSLSHAVPEALHDIKLPTNFALGNNNTPEAQTHLCNNQNPQMVSRQSCLPDQRLTHVVHINGRRTSFQNKS